MSLESIVKKIIATALTLSLVSTASASTKKFYYFAPVNQNTANYTKTAPVQAPPFALSRTPLLIETSGDAKNISSTGSYSLQDQNYKLYDPKKDALEIEIANNANSITVGYKIIQEKNKEPIADNQKYFHFKSPPNIYVAVPEGTNISETSYKICVREKDGKENVIDGVPHSLTQINQTAGVINRFIDQSHEKTENELPELLSNFGEATGTSKGIEYIEGFVAGMEQAHFNSVQNQFPGQSIYVVKHGEIQKASLALTRLQIGEQITLNLDRATSSANIAIPILNAFRGPTSSSQSQSKSIDNLIYKIQLEDATSPSATQNDIEGRWQFLFSENGETAPKYMQFEITPKKIKLRDRELKIRSIPNGILDRGCIELEDKNPPAPFTTKNNVFFMDNIIYFAGAYWKKFSDPNIIGTWQKGTVNDSRQPDFGLETSSGLFKGQISITPEEFKIFDEKNRPVSTEKITKIENINGNHFLFFESGKRTFVKINNNWLETIYNGQQIALGKSLNQTKASLPISSRPIPSSIGKANIFSEPVDGGVAR